MNKLKILHLGKYDSTSPEAGGVESAIENITKQLKNEYDQIIVAFTRKYKKIKFIQSDSGTKHLLIPVHLIIGYAPVNFFLPVFLKRLINTFSPDIIYVHMPSIMPFSCLNELKNRKTIVFWHADVEGTRVSKNWSFPVYRLFEQQLLKNARSIITTSPHYLDSSRSLKRYKKKCSIIPLGIEYITDNSGDFSVFTDEVNKTSKFSDAIITESTELPDAINESTVLPDAINDFIKTKRLILSVGRLAYYKGYTFLVEAMQFVKNDNVVLLIAGEGNERQEIEQKITDLNLKTKVMLPGTVTNMEKKLLLSKAEIFCLPSIDRAEAFGVSLLEAMQFNLPLVTTRVKGSGMNYVNIHNKTGLSVQPSNSFELAMAFTTILNNPGLAKKFGDNAKQRFIDHFHARNMAKNIAELG